MKLTAIIIFVATMHVAAKSTGQTVTLKVKDVLITEVFSSIQKQTGYNILVDASILDDASRVSLDVKEMPVEKVMEMCLKNQPYQFSVGSNSIVIKTRIDAAVQPRLIVKKDPPVTGVVRGPDRQPLQGVNVVIRGTNKGTVTDRDGRFFIEAKDGSALEISSIGFGKKVIRINGTQELEISLAITSSILDEVQVIPYGTQSKRFSVGNVATVKAEDIEKQPVSNPLLALQGRVTGVEITQLTGLNGGGVTVRIQGRNSIKSGLDPFIVIDGVPFPSKLFLNNYDETLVQGGSPLNYLSPADIESIDILKDADATAIYGSRAANGAILITTKKGKVGKTKLNLNFQQGWSKVTRFAQMLNTRQYLDMRYEAMKNDGTIPSVDPRARYPNLYAPDLTIWDTTRYTNWQKELIGGDARYTNINTSISGGNALVNYLIGGAFNRQTTVFPGSFDDKKGGLHFNINASSVNQKFTVQLTGSFMYDQNHLPGVDLTARAVYLEPMAPALLNSDGSLNWAPRGDGRSTWQNPLAFTENSDFNNRTNNLTTNMAVKYDLLPNFSIGSTFGYTNTQADIYVPFRLESNRPEVRAGSQRAANFGMRTMSNWIIEPQLRYSDELGKGKAEGLLGTSIQSSGANGLLVSAFGFPSDQLMRSPSAAPTRNVDVSSSFQYKYVGVFGRLNYNWDEKYIISINVRRDGSSRFGDKSKFHNFWSIGAGWIFSEANWMNDASFLSFGKLRASFGTTGNDQIPDYGYTAVYTTNNPSIAYQGASGLGVVGIPNPYLQWEETKKWQGGIDLGILNDRVLFGVTYAHNLSSNQLISYLLPDVSGFPTITKNFPATIRNTSWEFTLHSVNVKSRNFIWESDLNLTIPNNKLIKFPNFELTSYASGNEGIIIGEPLGVQKLLPYAGVDPATGGYLVIDKDGKPTLTPDFILDATTFITPRTKFNGGWLNKFKYKNWQLDVLFQYVYQISKTDIYYGNPELYPGSYASFTGIGGANQPVTILNHWQKPGDNAVTGIFSTNRYSSRNVIFSDAVYNHDASFIRLKNVAFSWQLPNEWMKKIKLQNGSLYFRGENLATITKFAGMDPESQIATSLPPLQTWTFGINVGL